MSSKSVTAAVSSLSFEAALAELETIVRNLESGKAALDDSISAYERGIALKKHCEGKLREAHAKIEKITIGSDGKPTTVPFDPEE